MTAAKGTATGQGYNFGGDRARRLAATMDRIKRDPNHARRLFGLAPSKENT